ncbi:TPA: hypothetical protein ACKQPR_000437 [Serratia odorifera]|nr:hypothetical protein [Serratia odorifera]
MAEVLLIIPSIALLAMRIDNMSLFLHVSQWLMAKMPGILLLSYDLIFWFLRIHHMRKFLKTKLKHKSLTLLKFIDHTAYHACSFISSFNDEFNMTERSGRRAASVNYAVCNVVVLSQELYEQFIRYRRAGRPGAGPAAF